MSLSKGDFFLFGGYLKRRAFDMNVYNLNLNQKTMTLFEAVREAKHTDSAVEDEDQAIQASALL